DEWILSELSQTIAESIQGYDIYDFNVPAKALRKFTIDLFASQYIEMVKGRAYNRDEAFSEKEQNAAHYTLHKALNTIIKAFAPLVPFVTDFIYRGLHGKSVHTENFPDPKKIIKEKKFIELTDVLLESNSLIWKLKKDMKLPLNTPIKKAILPKSLDVFVLDLKTMHTVEQISSEESELDSEVKKFSLVNGEELIISL
ncbi:MAG: class I tRNA ligase family protein, partial [Candidatus Heimdallarchaeota archaeon]|nr:class I tRNA ligase family protein [Candidatus Heimdallarchaeota archaeon]